MSIRARRRWIPFRYAAALVALPLACTPFNVLSSGAVDGPSSESQGTGLVEADARVLSAYRLQVPVAGVDKRDLVDTYNDKREGHAHEALDIPARRGTQVVAAGDGRIVKLFYSRAGGLTVYQLDPSERFAYYYAHLDGYDRSMTEGVVVKRGDAIGTVGSTGNAREDSPHLHFAIFKLGAEKQWWKGTPINPFPLLD